MRPKTLVPAIFLGSFFALFAAPHASAATVRGSVIHQNGKAAAGYAVTVLNSQNTRSSPAKVGTDGLYYVPNISQGSYKLEVWIPGQNPVVYEIQVHEPYTDIPQVKLP